MRNIIAILSKIISSISIFAALALSVSSSLLAGEFMTEGEYTSKYAGNTASGKWDGIPYYELMKPNGELSGKWKGNCYTGNWCFGNEKSKKGKCVRDPLPEGASYTVMCVNYAGYTDDDDCWQVIEKSGDAGFSYEYHKKGKMDFTEKVLPGNPKNL